MIFWGGGSRPDDRTNELALGRWHAIIAVVSSGLRTTSGREPAMPTTFDAPFPRGSCPIHAFGPVEDRSVPIVLFFPDAFGPRDATFAIAEDLAAQDWRVFMLDQFYEHIPYEPLKPKSIFQGEGHDALMKLFGSITQAKIDADVAAMIALAEARSDPGVPFAATGYCMGGRYVLTAVTSSERVVFAAAFHASNIAPAEGDSAHTRFASAKGRIYIGSAGVDPTYDAAEHGRLAEALRAADTDHMIENYKGAAHGWVMPDIPIYDAAAAARHMHRLKENLGELFAR
jgi:carboxymethylenebutenolidase